MDTNLPTPMTARVELLIYQRVIYNLYPFMAIVFPLKMVIIHSYVSLPEGNLHIIHPSNTSCATLARWAPAPSASPVRGPRDVLLPSIWTWNIRKTHGKPMENPGKPWKNPYGKTLYGFGRSANHYGVFNYTFCFFRCLCWLVCWLI